MALNLSMPILSSLAGDINADFIRNTCHTNRVNDLLEDLELTKSWDKFLVDFTCCHELIGTSHVSVLNHFFWSEQFQASVIDAEVLHLPDNQSDHSPIYCVVEYLGVHQEVQQNQAKQKPKPNWKKASQDQKSSFKTTLEEKISNLFVPFSVTRCRNVKCKDKEHREDLDIFTLELLETVQEVAEESLPVPAADSRQDKKVTGGNWSGHLDKKHISGIRSDCLVVSLSTLKFIRS